MAISKKDAVKFVYVNGSSLPATIDDSTIYILSGTAEMYVGSMKIATKVDVDSVLDLTSSNPVENKVITEELNKKADIDSPAFTGIPSAPTAAKGTKTTQIATTAFVDAAISSSTQVVDDAINATSTNPVQNKVIKAALDLKADLASPTFTGTPKAPTAAAGTNDTQIATTAFVTSAVEAAKPTYTAKTGKPTANLTPAFGGTATISQVTQATTGQVNVTDRTITIPGTEATTSAKGLMSSADKTKLDGIADNANNYTHPSYTARTGQPTANQTPAFGGTATVSQITSDATGHITGATNRTITIPKTEATTSAAGLMSAADKTKLDGIATGANKTTVDSTMSTTSTNPVQNKVVNQAISDAIAASDAMIFKGTLGTGGTITALPTTYKTGWTYRVITAGTYAGNVCEVGDLIIALEDRSGSGNVNADWTVAQTNIDGAITNITVTAPIVVSGSGSSRALSHKAYTARTGKPTANATPAFGGTFTVSQITSDATGHVTNATDRTITIPSAVASTSAAGLMSSDDKTKLDGIATGANAYTHPSYTARTGVPTANATPAFGGTFNVNQVVSDATGHVTAVTSRTITIPKTEATTSAAGLLSSADKTKLDGIATGAQVNSITGVKGNAESKYRTGNVNLTPANVGALALTGGTVSGATTFQNLITLYRSSTTADNAPAGIKFSIADTTTGKTYSSAYLYAYQDHAATTNGANIVLNSGGATIIGSGEAAAGHYAALKGDDNTGLKGEEMYLTSDTLINIQGGGQSIASRKGVQITSAGALVPVVADVVTNNVQSIGTSAAKWNAMYATTFYGALSGNATTATSATKLGTARTIDGVSFDGSAAIVHYGTCSTAAGTAAKVVACTSFALVTGSTIRVKFTVTNTAASPTLNVNSTGAKNIFYKGAAITAGYLIKDHVYEFVYDGTQYCLVGEIYSATTASIGSASAGTAIAADDITAWSAGTAASASVSGGVLTITNGTAPSLSYTARSIPNITVTSKTVVTAI